MAAQNCPCFPGPRDKNEFKTEMKEVMRTTKQRFRYQTKNREENNNSQEEKENLTSEEIHQRLKRLEDLDENLEESDYDGDHENLEESDGDVFKDDAVL